MSLEEQFATRFRCPKCQSSGAATRRVSTAGTGLSKLLDIQHNQFITVSCQHCGFTEMYDPSVLEGKRHLGNVLDLLFGR